MLWDQNFEMAFSVEGDKHKKTLGVLVSPQDDLATKRKSCGEIAREKRLDSRQSSAAVK